MKSIISWHRGALEKFMKYTNLDWYQLSWIGFIKGIILTVLIYEYFIS